MSSRLSKRYTRSLASERRLGELHLGWRAGLESFGGIGNRTNEIGLTSFRDAFSFRPSGEEGPTRRSSKCHATFESARRGRSYTLPDLRVYDLPKQRRFA